MKKNLVKKAVLPVFVALLCSVIALTSVSYAWFSLGNTAKVEGMEMNVTTADGLQISSTGNAAEFKSTLDLEVTKANVNPVSTDGTYQNNMFKFYTGEVIEGALGDVEEANSSNYITFDFYVKVSSNTTLQLDYTSVVTAVANTNNKTLETNLAARVAFIDLGSAKAAADAQALDPATVAAGSVKIWEPNSNTRSTAAQNANAATGKLDYKGVIGIADASKKTPTYSDGYVSTFDFIGANENKSVELFGLEEGYNKVRVYIWLEGQDVDCVNEVSGGTFTITLNLSKPE